MRKKSFAEFVYLIFTGLMAVVSFKFPFAVVSKIWLFLEILDCYIILQTKSPVGGKV